MREHLGHRFVESVRDRLVELRFPVEEAGERRVFDDRDPVFGRELLDPRLEERGQQAGCSPAADG